MQSQTRFLNSFYITPPTFACFCIRTPHHSSHSYKNKGLTHHKPHVFKKAKARTSSMPETHTVAVRHAHKNKFKKKKSILFKIYINYSWFFGVQITKIRLKTTLKPSIKPRKPKQKSYGSYFLQPKSKKQAKKHGASRICHFLPFYNKNPGADASNAFVRTPSQPRTVDSARCPSFTPTLPFSCPSSNAFHLAAWSFAFRTDVLAQAGYTPSFDQTSRHCTLRASVHPHRLTSKHCFLRKTHLFEEKTA